MPMLCVDQQDDAFLWDCTNVPKEFLSSNIIVIFIVVVVVVGTV